MTMSPVERADWHWTRGVSYCHVEYKPESGDNNTPPKTGGELSWVEEISPEDDDRGNGSCVASSQPLSDFLCNGPRSRPPVPVVESLLAYFQTQPPSWFDSYRLLDAASRQDLTTVQELLALGVSPNTPMIGMTPLYEAVRLQNLVLAEMLFAAGVDVSRRSSATGETILPTLAVCAPDATWEPLAARILAAGADLETRTRWGETPLMAAANAANRLPGLVRLLLDAGADVNARSTHGYTALMEVVQPHYTTVEVIQDLLDAGADIDALDENGWSALMWAISSTATAAVRCLVAAGADVHTVSTPKDKHRKPQSVLQLAVSYANPAIVACIREACENKNPR